MLIKSIAIFGVLVAVSACVPKDSHIETQNISTNPFITQGPMDDALRCLAQFDAGDVRIGVTSVDDMTGRYDLDGQGSFLTRGGSYMLMTAFQKAGMKQVQRSNTVAIEWERDHALKKGLGDGKTNMIGNKEVNYRLVKEGDILGSTHMAGGAFTALDFNLASGGAELSVANVGVGYRSYTMAVGFDFIVTNTRTTEILYAEPYSMRLGGQEFNAGVFRFFSGDLVDANAGYETHDPLQFGAKYVLEYAAYDISRRILNAGDACDTNLPEAYAGYSS